jgi:hypothetical protein
VYKKVALLALIIPGWASTTANPAAAVRAKLAAIESGKTRAGSVFTFSPVELNAYVRSELPTVAPAGVRQTNLELGSGTATGSALIDFVKLRTAQGEKTPWLVSKIIEGEKFVKVNTRIESAHGKATVFLQRVEISGLAVSGSTLDFLIHTFFMPLFPEAKINQPFTLQDRVDRIEVSPTGARVVIGR